MTLLFRKLLTSKDKSSVNVTCHQREFRRTLQMVDKFRQEFHGSEAQ